jgi:hypothetical protein
MAVGTQLEDTVWPTGFETPIAIGFLKATGMVFVPNS